MPFSEVGEYQLGRGTKRCAPHCERQDEVGTARPPAESPRSHRATEPLEDSRKTRGRLGLACGHKGRSHQSRQSEITAQEGPETLDGPPLRGVLDPSHLPYPTRRERV